MVNDIQNNLSTQVSPRQARLETWVRFLRAHAAITRQLNADLIASHELTLSDYEVLLHLADAPERALRRIDLADRVLLTPSGITRLLNGLECAGFVERGDCASDGRVVYARLTEAGLEKLREASATHLAGVGALFTERFSTEELEQLGWLLARLPAAGPEGPACAAD